MKRNQSAAGATRRGESTKPTRTWRVLEAMAYAGAFIDPTGALVLQRLRQLRDGAR